MRFSSTSTSIVERVVLDLVAAVAQFRIERIPDTGEAGVQDADVAGADVAGADVAGADVAGADVAGPVTDGPSVDTTGCLQAGRILDIDAGRTRTCSEHRCDDERPSDPSVHDEETYVRSSRPVGRARLCNRPGTLSA